MIKQVHIFGMGFTQTVARLTGIEQVWREARMDSTPQRWIYPPVTWDVDVEALAAFIARHSPPDAEIYVHAYSYGGGWMFPRLARAFGELNRSIEHACLCDPVHRDSFILLRWRAMTDWPTIKVPANVKAVSWVRQTLDRPRAHDLVADDPKRTLISLPELVYAGHNAIDESPQFRRMVMKTINPF